MVVELEQRLRVHADLPVDDELEPRQADARVAAAGEKSNACSGLPTFIMILTGISGMRVELDLARRSNSSRPVVDVAGVALGAGDGDLVRRRASARVASPQPTTAGMPSSRAMIAAWQVRPPRLVTIAAARFMTGSQSGSVMSATSTSPALHSCHLGRRR